jgi:hypothetical protein
MRYNLSKHKKSNHKKRKRFEGRTRLSIELLEDRFLPSSIWGTSAAPAVASVNDPSPVELGVRFRSDVAGYITGVAFYKGAANGGTHVGHLWTNSGTLLASATFTGETATGWETVSFASPVAIAANTTYVASYYAPTGGYAYTKSYFATAGVDNPPLHALADGVDGHDGVYLYGSGAGFPNASANSANYWVDVVFNTTPTDPTLPTVVTGLPAANATQIDPGTSITAVFNKSVVASSIVFALTDPNNNPVAASVTYDDSTHTATLVPSAPLSKLAKYTATVSAAQDTYGNHLAAPLTWSFTTGNPPVLGEWSQPINWPLVAINVVLLHTGKVLMWDGGGDCIGSSSAHIWDPSTGVFTAVPGNFQIEPNDIFCSGMVSLSDGRILVIGGHDCTNVGVGTARVDIFDPVTQQWMEAPDMVYPRWYPTGTVLGDGQVLITSGADATNTSFIRVPELYDPNTNTSTALSQAGLYVPSYPFVFQLPDGRILEAGSGEFDSKVGAITPTMVLDLKTQTWTTIDPNPISGSSSVMYLPGKIMTSGSAYDAVSGSSSPSSSATYVLDMTQASPKWQQTNPMPVGRSYDTLTILPTGAVLATGGSTIQDPVNLAYAVKSAALWDPNTQTWTTMASEQIPRIYHSTALLLPDGRVLVAGGGRDYGKEQANETNAEIYSPAYLFKGARPTITAAPATVSYSSSFVVQTPDAANITSVVLVRDGAMTHSLNMDQRYVPLSFQQTAGGLTVQAPVDGNTAPPGYYMLFLVNSNGVPSIASFIQLTGPQVTATSPAIGASLVSVGANVTVTFNRAMDPTSITSNTVQLLDASGKPVAVTVSYNAGTNTATLTPNSPLAGSSTYTIVARGNASGGRVKDALGDPMSADYLATFQTATLPGAGPFSLWAPTATPSVTSANDSSAVELGVQFRSDVSGYISGIRFYKGAGNTGTHIGNLWTSTGQLLATATFTNETASGWQQVTFASPVAIKANTVYVASYYAPAGHYAFDYQYLTSRVDSGPLHALANFVDGNNGAYIYGSNAFPTQGNGNNYWVDVVFSTPATSQLQISGFPTSATAGTSYSFTVTAKDAFGNTTSGYNGTVTFSSSDSQGGLPSSYTFTSADAGVHTFSATLKTASTQSLSVKDSANPSIASSTESGISVSPAATSQLQMTGFPASVTAGTSYNLTVTAKDSFGNTTSGYTGTVTFSSSDNQAGLPTSYTFTSADAGMHTFSATLKTAGAQSLTVKDAANSNIASGTVSGISVSPATTNQLQIAGFPTSVAAGTSFNFTVTAKDPYGNTTPSYTGTVTFTSTDSQAVLPASYTFASGDAGLHTFSATLKTAGPQSLTVKDAANSSVASGSVSGITVNPAATSLLQLTGIPASLTAGTSFSFTVTAKDTYGNITPSYTGTVTFSSTDGQAGLPASYTFTSGDAGIHTYSAALKTAGTQSLTVQDTASSSVASSTVFGISVSPATTSQLQITGFPASLTAGTSVTLTVIAKDAYGNTTPSYTGTVTSSSTDSQAGLPANYTFATGDVGIHTFSTTLKTAGTQSLTVKDATNFSIAPATLSGITVNPAATSLLQMTSIPASLTAGTFFSFTVTAKDTYGNTTSGYNSTVTFSSTDSQAGLPASYTFTSGDAGVHTFSATIKTAGTQSLTVKDTANSSIASGTVSGITVNAATVSQLQVAGFPASVAAGTAGNFTVTALDPYANLVSAYTGTVAFASSDSLASLPANYSFTASDNGSHIFSAVLNTAGTQSISATDTANSNIIGSQTGITVMPAPPIAGISGPSAAVPGQPLIYVLKAVESGVPASTLFSFAIQWGDGSPVQTLAGPTGTQVTHVFTAPGNYTVRLTDTDSSSNASAPVTMTVAITTVLMEPDPYDPSLTALYMGGTTGNDTIAITPVAGNGVQAAMNFVNYGHYFPTGHVVVYGQSGNDIIKTAPMSINGVLTYVSVPALFFAGNGTDILNATGSIASNVLVGGSGSDRLLGGKGQDILIGGSGSSTLNAGSGGDILIGGTTSYDNNAATLAAVLAEWSRTDIDYATRIAHLTGSLSGGLNGGVLLNSSTVQADGQVNDLYGGPGLDWFFAGILDVLFGKAPSEVVTPI